MSLHFFAIPALDPSAAQAVSRLRVLRLLLGFCLGRTVDRVDARRMDQAWPPVRCGFGQGGKLQGARGAGSGLAVCQAATALRVADFGRFC